jgi:hypothetical protein
MKQTILKMITTGPDNGSECLAENIVTHFKAFINWLHNPKCEFATCFNGVDKTRDKICYERNAKHYTIDQVSEYWQNHKA